MGNNIIVTLFGCLYNKILSIPDWTSFISIINRSLSHNHHWSQSMVSIVNRGLGLLVDYSTNPSMYSVHGAPGQGYAQNIVKHQTTSIPTQFINCLSLENFLRYTPLKTNMTLEKKNNHLSRCISYCKWSMVMFHHYVFRCPRSTSQLFSSFTPFNWVTICQSFLSFPI